MSIVPLLLLVLTLQSGPHAAASPDAWFAPEFIQPGLAPGTVLIGGARAGKVVEWSVEAQTIRRTFDAGRPLTGLAIAASTDSLIVTADSQVREYEFSTGSLRRSLKAHAGARQPLISRDGTRLYVCNQFDGSITRYEVPGLRELETWAVGREPVAAALANPSVLVIAHLLPEGRSDGAEVAAAVTLWDVAAGSLLQRVPLPSGSAGVRGIAVSPSGRWCASVHGLGRFHVPAVQVAHGWMNVSALTLIDLAARKRLATVLLDEPRAGAANPWAVAWTPDERQIMVAHAGTHELSFIDVEGLWLAMDSKREELRLADLDLLKSCRRRVPLKGNGPRSLLLLGQHVLVPEFFSDSLSIVGLDAPHLGRHVELFSATNTSLEREGERLFHDATISTQNWQSCASCHPDARADGLNWDLLNDGVGNPKNTKSLLLSHQTPPAMSLGRRESAQAAVRAGLRHIHFALRPEAEAQALDAYLSALLPEPSPWRSDPVFRAAAARGRQLFDSPEVGCARCHPAPRYTDLNAYAVGTLQTPAGRPAALDTPTLIEVWRTAPYLHDGSAATIQEVLTVRNPKDQHGRTSRLSPAQLADLCAFVRSL